MQRRVVTHREAPARGFPLPVFKTAAILAGRREAVMSKKKCILSRECIDRLHAWVLAHCPCALEDPEFFRGMLVVVDMEVREVIGRDRGNTLDRLKPSDQ